MALPRPRPGSSLKASLTVGSGPMFRRLAAALEAAIASGDHAVGSRLPPERTLAAELGVARVTVVAAYDLLRDAGLVERRRGSGTVVAGRPPGAAPWVGAALNQVLAGSGPVPGELHAEQEGAVAFTIAGLPGLDQVATRAARFVIDELPALVRGYGYAAAGLDSLRSAIADRYTGMGLPTAADELVVTTGAQQAIDLIVSLLVAPGSVALVDDPTYPGVLDALRAAGARVVGVPVDAAGMRPDLLEDAVARWHPRLVYLVATHHNPTGATVSIERRRQIVAIAERAGVPLVDDLALTGLALDGRPEPPPLAAIADGAPVISVGSMSKLVWGGLRIGWIRAPTSFTRQVIRLKLAADHGGSLVSQGIAVSFVPELDAIADARREGTAAGCTAVLDELTAQLPDWRWTRPAGGLSIWARIPRGTAATLAELAAARGVIVVPGPTFSASGGSIDRIRLPFGGDPEAMREGVRRLALAWADYRPLAAGERTPMRVVV